MTDHERYRLFRLATIMCACIAAIALVVLSAVALWVSTQHGLESADAVRRGGERATCDARYAQAASSASRRQLAIIADMTALDARLLKVIATVPASDPETRAAEAADIIAQTDQLADELDRQRPIVEAANAARDRYLVDGRPLPCPLDQPAGG